MIDYSAGTRGARDNNARVSGGRASRYIPLHLNLSPVHPGHHLCLPQLNTSEVLKLRSKP